MCYFIRKSSIDKEGSSSQQSVRDHPQDEFDPKELFPQGKGSTGLTRIHLET
jgi:hypothetical protein